MYGKKKAMLDAAADEHGLAYIEGVGMKIGNEYISHEYMSSKIVSHFATQIVAQMRAKIEDRELETGHIVELSYAGQGVYRFTYKQKGE